MVEIADRGWEWAEQICPGCSTAWDLHWHNLGRDPPIVSLVEMESMPITSNVIWAIMPLCDGSVETWFYRTNSQAWMRGPTLKSGVTWHLAIKEPEDGPQIEINRNQ